jgi:hypothetical protein
VGTAVAALGNRRTSARCTLRAAPVPAPVPLSAEPRTDAAPSPAPLAAGEPATAPPKKKRGRQAGQKLGVQAQPELLEMEPGRSRLRDRDGSIATKHFGFEEKSEYFHNSGWHGTEAVAREVVAQQVCAASSYEMADRCVPSLQRIVDTSGKAAALLQQLQQLQQVTLATPVRPVRPLHESCATPLGALDTLRSDMDNVEVHIQWMSQHSHVA